MAAIRLLRSVTAMKSHSLRQNKSRPGAEPPRKQNPKPRITRLNGKLKRRLAERTAQVREQTQQLRAMARKLTQVERHERRRLAGILHHRIQQHLFSARMHLSIVNRAQLPVAARNALCRADAIVGEAIGDCRSLAVDLSPPVLHEAGLGAALDWLARRMATLHRFTVELHIDSHAEPHSAVVRLFLFEALRELLLNSCKHSGCTSARVRMTRESKHWLRIAVEDAGKGFDLLALCADKARGESFGLLSIQQRLAQFGARMELESAPGEGTRIEILAPAARVGIGNRGSNGRTAPMAGQDEATKSGIIVPANGNPGTTARRVTASVLLRQSARRAIPDAFDNSLAKRYESSPQSAPGFVTFQMG
jgi:signal transduction histidine kinase